MIIINFQDQRNHLSKRSFISSADKLQTTILIFKQKYKDRELQVGGKTQKEDLLLFQEGWRELGFSSRQ